LVVSRLFQIKNIYKDNAKVNKLGLSQF
jgi:hypothetical protein